MNNDRLKRSLSKPRPCFAKTTSIRGGAVQAIAVARTCPDVQPTPVKCEGQKGWAKKKRSALCKQTGWIFLAGVVTSVMCG
jgi:hypothetical protein